MNPLDLTANECAAWHALAEYVLQHRGLSPSFDDVGRLAGLSRQQTATAIEGLDAKGYLAPRRHSFRTLRPIVWPMEVIA